MNEFDEKIEDISKNAIVTRVGDMDKSPFRLIKPVLVTLKGISSSAEARATINQIMNIAYYGIKNREHVLVLGDSIKNDEEDLSDYDYLNRIISDYSEFDILNLYGLSLNEYGDKTVYEQHILMKNALKLMEIKARREENMLNDIKDKEAALNKRKDGFGDLDE